MKRVVIFRHNILGLSETFIRDQARFLSNWEVQLAGYTRVENGLDVGDLPVTLIRGPQSGRIGRRLYQRTRRRGTVHQPTRRALKKLDPDLVHVHFGTYAVDLWPSVRELDVPVLVTLHGTDINTYREWWETGHAGQIMRQYPARLLAMAQSPKVQFLAVSKAIKKRAIDFGLPASKVTVAYIGIDSEQRQLGTTEPAYRPRRILFVGRMIENKGPLLLIRAFAKIKEQFPDAGLVMIGDGPLFNDARTLAAGLGVPVVFMGSQPSETVMNELQKARVFCLPSMTIASGASEGLPMVIIEAQASGVPVVTSARGGATEGIIHGKTGYAFDEGSLDGLVAGLQYYLSDDRQSATSADEIAQFARSRFDIRDCTRRLEAIFTQAVERHVRKC